MYCKVDCQAVRQTVGFQISCRMCSFCNLVHELPSQRCIQPMLPITPVRLSGLPNF